MKRITKYPLGFNQTMITMPALSQVVSVGEQNGNPYLFVAIDTDMPNINVLFLTLRDHYFLAKPGDWHFLSSFIYKDETYNVFRWNDVADATAEAMAEYFIKNALREGK